MKFDVGAGGAAGDAGAGSAPPHATLASARRSETDPRRSATFSMRAAYTRPRVTNPELSKAPLEERIAFVREHTTPARVAFVPEVVIQTATDMTPLWRATADWLGARGVDVPFWSVPWAGGQAVARFVLDRPNEVKGLRVLDFGAGSGLVGIACALAGARSVTTVDIDPLAEAACLVNAERNGVALDVVTTDITGSDVLPADVDVLVAGDVWYERAASKRFANWLGAVAARGVRVLTGDPGRTYVPKTARELARFDVPTTLDLESVTTRVARVLTIGSST